MTLAEFLNKPSWSKEVVLYVGNKQAISSAVAHRFPVVELDLLDMSPGEDEGSSASDIRADYLTANIDKRLRHEKQRALERTVFVIENAALLARYGVGAAAFYDWLGGANAFTILHCDKLRPVVLSEAVQRSILCDSSRLVDYFRSTLISSDRVIVEAT